MPGNPGTLGLGAVAATPATVLQVRCTGARFRAGRRVGVPRACAGEVGKAGGWGGRDCVFSLLYGTGYDHLAGPSQRLPEWVRVPHHMLGQPFLSVHLDLQESNVGHQSADSLQDLI